MMLTRLLFYFSLFNFILDCLFISVMGNEHNKQLYGDFGVGLGFMIICIAFMEYIPYKPIVRLPFFLFFGTFGIYGVLRAVTEKILDIYNLKNVSEATINKKKSTIKLVAIQQAVIYLIEFLAALVTVLQYIGITFP
ncbi:MAG: hypothetical protein SOR27_00140 [Streptococcus pluranimalium]|nr:hypothetical protein [Streptococcus pluranimalium]